MFEQLHVPQVFAFLCQQWFALSPRHTRRWWLALSHAQGQRAIALRSAIQLQAALPYRRAQLDTLAYHTLAPDTLVATVEDLCSDALLTRHEGTLIEEAIFARITAEGRWK